MRLPDKIVLITSAQHPCARDIAVGFAREGANCAVVDADASRAEQIAVEVRSLGRRALSLQCDVTRKSEVEEVVRRAISEFHRIDVLLNCSALSYESDFLNFTEKHSMNASIGDPKPTFLLARLWGGRWPHSAPVRSSIFRPPMRGSHRANRPETARLVRALIL